MRILSAINAALFLVIAINGIWEHDTRVLIGSAICLIIWAVIWPDLTANAGTRYRTRPRR